MSTIPTAQPSVPPATAASAAPGTPSKVQPVPVDGGKTPRRVFRKTRKQRLLAAKLLVTQLETETAVDTEAVRTRALCIVGETVVEYCDQAVQDKVLSLVIGEYKRRHVVALFQDRLEDLVD